MSFGLQLEVPHSTDAALGYRVVQNRYGIAIYGSVPIGNFNVLCKHWGKEDGFKFLRSDVADVLGASAAVVRNEADASAWLKELGIRLDHPDWLKTGDCGISSKTIYATFTGQWHILRRGMDDAAPPSDSDDFGRCYRLLKRNPEWRAQIDKVAVQNVGFAALVPIWGDLENLFEGQKFAELNKRISDALNAKR